MLPPSAGPQDVGPQELFVLLYGGADEGHLLLSDYIKPHPTVVRVAASSNVTGSDISLDEALQKEKIDILLIPGGTLPESTATLVDALKKLVKVADHTIAIDSGVTLLARTELLNGHILAAETLKIEVLKDEFPEIRWEDVSLYRNGQYWSAVGAPGVFRPLGNIFSLALKNHVGYWYPFLPSMPRKRPLSFDAAAESAESNKKRFSAGETAAKEILAHTEVDHIFLTAGDFAGRLACESFLDAGNSILLALLDTFPNSDNKVGLYVRHSFEFLWEQAGARPPVPWEQPSAEELAEWAKSMRGNWPADDERESTFETLCDMVALGDLDPRPYSLTTTLALAVELDQQDKVQELGDLLARRQSMDEHPATWIQISKYRTLAGLILDGTFKRSSDQTADIAQQDADTVIAAIRAWPGRNSVYRAARSQRQAALSTPLCSSIW
ncbi:hypothetical protein EWM64_g7628 [Hericium alpestre]|uniref:DJ-1/PfpI domain-containing protein n=1 Tax=Hericium alpestre TaxID=135208 RepID=A0A4Y9ZQP6_9AGAM|nr:hypothetical protein EWM64_g7628 [Hericium alpestre]